MYRIRGEIQGVAPILFHRFTEEAVADMEAKKTGGRMTVDERVTEALAATYRNANGLCIPAANFKKCLLEGAQRAQLREGRGSLVPYLRATVFVDGHLNFGVSEPDYIDEQTGRRPPKTGGACVIRRPALRVGWRLPFELVVTDDRRSPDHIRRALEEAGLLVGLCDGRPDFGRFLLMRWEVITGHIPGEAKAVAATV